MAAKQKILIVDDDANIAELISLYLTKECYDTRMVHDDTGKRGFFPSEASVLINIICINIVLWERNT